jgi:hypothetical protein
MVTQPLDDDSTDDIQDEEFSHTIRGQFEVDVRTTGFKLTNEDMDFLSEWLEGRFTLPNAEWNSDRKYGKGIERLSGKLKTGKLFTEEWELIQVEMESNDYEPNDDRVENPEHFTQ